MGRGDRVTPPHQLENPIGTGPEIAYRLRSIIPTFQTTLVENIHFNNLSKCHFLSLRGVGSRLSSRCRVCRTSRGRDRDYGPRYALNRHTDTLVIQYSTWNRRVVLKNTGWYILSRGTTYIPSTRSGRGNAQQRLRLIPPAACSAVARPLVFRSL